MARHAKRTTGWERVRLLVRRPRRRPTVSGGDVTGTTPLAGGFEMSTPTQEPQQPQDPNEVPEPYRVPDTETPDEGKKRGKGKDDDDDVEAKPAR